MRTRRVRSAALLVAAVTLVLAAGCSSSRGTAANTAAPEKPNLTVAVVPALDSAGFFIALYGGLFTAQGLHVTFVPATSSETAISQQVEGNYDITGGNYVSYIQAQQAKLANLDIFAEGSVMEPGAQALYTMPGSPIKTLANLKGRTVGINAPYNILYLLAASILSEHGAVYLFSGRRAPLRGRAGGRRVTRPGGHRERAVVLRGRAYQPPLAPPPPLLPPPNGLPDDVAEGRPPAAVAEMALAAIKAATAASSRITAQAGSMRRTETARLTMMLLRQARRP